MAIRVQIIVIQAGYTEVRGCAFGAASRARRTLPYLCVMRFIGSLWARFQAGVTILIIHLRAALNAFLSLDEMRILMACCTLLCILTDEASGMTGNIFCNNLSDSNVESASDG